MFASIKFPKHCFTEGCFHYQCVVEISWLSIHGFRLYTFRLYMLLPILVPCCLDYKSFLVWFQKVAQYPMLWSACLFSLSLTLLGYFGFVQGIHVCTCVCVCMFTCFEILCKVKDFCFYFLNNILDFKLNL